MSEYDHSENVEDLFLTRRALLSKMGSGFAMLGLAGVLGGEDALAAGPTTGSSLNPLAPRKAPLPAKAKRVIFLFMNGGPSQVDTFDPKPKLLEYVGKT